MALEIAGSVASRTLGQWRREHPSNQVRRDGPYASWIVAGNIGNLTTNHRYMTWNLVDSATRQDCVDDALASSHRIILPFFASKRLFTSTWGRCRYWSTSCRRWARKLRRNMGIGFFCGSPTTKSPPRYKHHGHFATDSAALAVETDLDLTKGDQGWSAPGRRGSGRFRPAVSHRR